MDDLDLDDLGDLDDLENIDCDWENSFEALAYDPPSTDDLQHNDSYISPGAPQPQTVVDPCAPTPISDNTSSSNDAAQIRVDRERDGRCADCGAQTHEIQVDNGCAMKIPLSVPGEVHRGRCLFCHPLPQSHRASTGSASQSRHTHGRSNKRQMDPAPTLDDFHELARNGEFNRLSSNASVSSLASNQSYHSQHSSNWGGGGQSQFQQQLMMQQQNRNGFSQEVMDQYNQMQLQQKQIQQQQGYADDAGSVYSHASQGSFHSNVSHQSHATYNSFMQHGHPPGLNNSISSNNQEFNPVIENILIQMQDDSLNFETVLQAMTQFPSHALIQENGCAILWVQTYNAEICHALTNVGGVNTIVEAMRNHPHVARLQRAACEALRNMCVVPLNRQIMLNQGGISILVETMQRHSDDAHIQRSGCTALASVADGGMKFKVGVAESGGILAVMKAVESHPENDLVLRSAYQALRMLGYNPGAGGY